MYRSGWTGAHNPHWRPLESHEQHMRAKTHHHELQHVVLYFFFSIRKLTMLSSGIYRICHSNPTRARSPCIASHGRLLTSQHCHRPIFLLAFGLLVPVAWNNFKDHTATSWHLPQLNWITSNDRPDKAHALSATHKTECNHCRASWS